MVFRRHKGSRSRVWRAKGDLARDGHNWESAVEAYGAHLELNDTDEPIWVQYGHALKESGRLLDALAAYERSATMSPDDDDRDQHLSDLRRRIAQLGDPSHPDSPERRHPGPLRSERVGEQPEVADAWLISARLRR